ncbi:MAG: universal stress protein [Myxococcaceae bacterium]
MRKILVGLNDTPLAVAGAQYAAQLAKATGSGLVLAYVSRPLPKSALREKSADELKRLEHAYAEELLGRAAAELRVECERVHAWGDPVEEILKLSERSEIWLTAAAARPRSGLGKVFYGGFAHRLARNAHRNVLVTHDDPNRMPLVVKDNRMPVYVVGIDGSEPSNRALDEAMALAKITSASLYVVSVIQPVFIAESFAIPSELAVSQQQHAEQVLRDARARVGEQVKAEFKTSVGSPALELEEVAKQVGGSLLVVGDTGRGAAGRAFFGSTADRLVNLAHRNVFVSKKH